MNVQLSNHKQNIPINLIKNGYNNYQRIYKQMPKAKYVI